MKSVLLLYLFLCMSAVSYANNVLSHASLLGAWSYFHVTADYFSAEKILATEQRLLFRDGQNVTLIISSKESEFIQNTTYNLKYTLSLRDNTTYLTLFSTESEKVIGAYVRMPLAGTLEFATDPNFILQKQLYKRVSLPVPTQTPSRTSSTPQTLK
ncbi:MAG: hypothetical protein ACRCVW_04480 [Brevinema sp.]